MPKITIEKASNIHIRCFSEPAVEQELSDYFTYSVPGAQFTPQFRSRLWDGKIRQYDRLSHPLRHFVARGRRAHPIPNF